MSDPIAAAEFAAAMARFDPFEPAPHLAVAVSGGRDSMALALLARDWAAGRGGRLLALTVDHAIRPEAAEEAATVGRWLDARGIPHRVLRHRGLAPRSRVQEAARAIRYGLLVDACRGEGILHLLLGHQRDDQAETVAIRAAQGSGPDGLAGMAPVRETAGPRLLRPLLQWPRVRMAATLAAREQPWIDDPSNADRRYARVRLRQGPDVPFLDPAGIRRAAAARAAEEAETARLAAELVWIGAEGYALVDMAGLSRRPLPRQHRLLQRVLLMVGGSPYPPRREALAALAAAFAGPGACGRTLAGCRILPWRGQILVCREAAAVGPDVTAAGPGRVCWDGRFAIMVPAGVPAASRIGALGQARPPGGLLDRVPGPVRETLPALWNGGVLLSVPTAGWSTAACPLPEAVFRPAQALAAGPFAVV